MSRATPGARPASQSLGVFAAGAATLALEILGPRHLAPLVGTSLSSMTAAIAVVMCGAGVGAAIAGRTDDRRASRRVEGWALVVAAMGVVLGTLLARSATASLPLSVPLLARALVGSLAMLGVASVAFGAVPVLAARRALAERPFAAGVVGRLSAIGTVGGVVGLFGVVAVIARVSVTMALLGVAFLLASVGAWLIASRPPPRASSASIRPPTATEPEVASDATIGRLSLSAALLGFSILSIEVIAVRRVAARVGSSLEAWTAVLAVVLIGIAIGAAIARDGAPRDPRARRPWFGVGAWVMLGLLDHRALDATITLSSLPPTLRVTLAVALTYGPAFVLLGAAGPRLSRAAAGLRRDAGRGLARISILATLGALVGTLLTAPLLLPALRSESALAVGSIAATLAISLVGRGSLRRFALGAAPALVVLAVVVAYPTALRARPPSNADPAPMRVVFDEDGPYARVAVVEIDDPDGPSRRISRLSIDARVHGVTDPRAPLPPRPNFASVATAVIDHVVGDGERPSLLVIGGGAYAVPRAFLATHPTGRCQAIELDPVVNAAARTHLGLVEDPRLLVIEGDARAVLTSDPRVAADSDFIFVDAFGDVSIPWTLTTVEFAREAKAKLRPGGTLIVNVIDAFIPGRLVAALHATLRIVFAHVDVLGARRDDERLQNFVFVASDTRRQLDGLSRATTKGPVPLIRYAEREWDDLTRRVGAQPLTDDFAPVEDLVSEIVGRTMGR